MTHVRSEDVIPLTQLDYNWYADIWMNNKIYKVVMDTSTSMFVIKFTDDDFTTYSNANDTQSGKNCIFLEVDQGTANFTSSDFKSGKSLCILGNDTTSIATTVPSSNITTTSSQWHNI